MRRHWRHQVTNEGIRGLEELESLEILRLSNCQSVSDVWGLLRAKNLLELDLRGSKVAVASITGQQDAGPSRRVVLTDDFPGAPNVSMTVWGGGRRRVHLQHGTDGH